MCVGGRVGGSGMQRATTRVCVYVGVGQVCNTQQLTCLASQPGFATKVLDLMQ